jgi:hypothetical protein
VTGQWFSMGPPVSSTNKTDCHDKTKILLKGELNSIKTNKQQYKVFTQTSFVPNYNSLGLVSEQNFKVLH